MRAVTEGSMHAQTCLVLLYGPDPWKQPCYKSGVFLSERHASREHPFPLYSSLAIHEKIEKVNFETVRGFSTYCNLIIYMRWRFNVMYNFP